MQRITILILGLILTISAQAKDFKYPTLLIPDSLKKSAYAVIRNEHLDVSILSQTKSRITLTKAITVLNSQGKEKAWEAFSYDKNKKILDITAKMYNAIGLELEKWSKKDWQDVSYDPYGTAYSDMRMLICKPVSNNYPYTIEYNVTFERNNTYMTDGWHPVWEDNLAIEKSSFTLSYSPEIKIKFKEYNFNNHIVKKSVPGTTTWQLTHMPAYKSEPYGPSKKDILPHINVDALQFIYEDYSGKSDTWANFGAFIGKLNEGRDELPEQRIKEIDAILDTCSNDASKVEALYSYMQSHTRYVNISIGIGGIQTFPAQTVSENGYGDCKALSNYMYSILKHAGIKSYFTLVNAGAFNYGFDVDYVGHQFNHAILCVPLPSDTLWLECTSQTIPCGFLGDFTDNRQVLLITDNGGVLTKTPKYGKAQNKLFRNAVVEIAETGDGQAKLISSYTGLEYDQKHKLTVTDKEEQKKMLYKELDIPNFKIDSFDLNCHRSKSPSLIEEINLSLPSYASKSGSRLFLPLNLASKWDYVPRKVKQRTSEIHVKSEFCNADTITYSIPENFNIEVVPDNYYIENKYGVYKSEISIKDNKLIYKRFIELNTGIFPANEYDDFVAFFEEIKDSDNAMAILKQND